jgi:hypothetical protein
MLKFGGWSCRTQVCEQSNESITVRVLTRLKVVLFVVCVLSVVAHLRQIT